MSVDVRMESEEEAIMLYTFAGCILLVNFDIVIWTFLLLLAILIYIIIMKEPYAVK